ncbi:MAG: hypothetical protein ACI80V_003265 [Rhodothermales bacterium]|jgi:hypothetical protein
MTQWNARHNPHWHLRARQSRRQNFTLLHGLSTSDLALDCIADLFCRDEQKQKCSGLRLSYRAITTRLFCVVPSASSWMK